MGQGHADDGHSACRTEIVNSGAGVRIASDEDVAREVVVETISTNRGRKGYSAHEKAHGTSETSFARFVLCAERLEPDYD